MKIHIIVLGFLLMIPTFPVHAYTVQRELKLDASGLEAMKISCGAGSLVVEGTPSNTIIVTAEIEISGMSDEESESFARENLTLWLRKDGPKAHLKSEIHKRSRRGNASINLTVYIPVEFHLDIKDGSGSIEVLSVKGDVRIRDDSGEIEIFDSGGDLDIGDGSGGIDIKNVQGNLTLNDGSGEIHIENVQGNGAIEDDSGDISIYRIGGDLEIADGSGSITVRDVNGGVVVADGSGSIDIQEVEKSVLIERDSSGSRHISKVRGDIIQKE